MGVTVVRRYDEQSALPLLWYVPLPSTAIFLLVVQASKAVSNEDTLTLQALVLAALFGITRKGICHKRDSQNGKHNVDLHLDEPE